MDVLVSFRYLSNVDNSFKYTFTGHKTWKQRYSRVTPLEQWLRPLSQSGDLACTLSQCLSPGDTLASGLREGKCSTHFYISLDDDKYTGPVSTFCSGYLLGHFACKGSLLLTKLRIRELVCCLVFLSCHQQPAIYKNTWPERKSSWKPQKPFRKNVQRSFYWRHTHVSGKMVPKAHLGMLMHKPVSTNPEWEGSPCLLSSPGLGLFTLGVGCGASKRSSAFTAGCHAAGSAAAGLGGARAERATSASAARVDGGTPSNPEGESLRNHACRLRKFRPGPPSDRKHCPGKPRPAPIPAPREPNLQCCVLAPPPPSPAARPHSEWAGLESRARKSWFPGLPAEPLGLLP